MYLRTPKRYQKAQRHFLNLRWLWLWILTPLVVIGGWQVYERRDELGPHVQTFISNAADSARTGVATMTAPTPGPTEDPTRRLTLARNAWQEGAIDEALRQYELILPNLPNDVESHYRYTFGLLMDGRNQEALEAAEKTVTANPFSSDAWAIRAQALNANGRQGEAIASAMQALQLNPDSARATAFLAEAYFDSNQVERALTTVESAMEMDPDSFEALYVYGRIQNESIFDFDEARRAFQQAYAIAPNMPYIGVEMAWLEYREDNAEAGFEALQTIAEMNPQNSNALFALGFLSYAYLGDPNQALDYLSRCVEANPRSVDCYWYLGTIDYALNQVEDAHGAFMRVIEIGTTNTRYYLSAGRINIELNRCSTAVPILRDGYQLEQDKPSPDPNRLSDFEAELQRCGVYVGLGPAAESTALPESTPERAGE